MPGADPNHEAQVKQAQSVASKFAAATTPEEKKALARQLKELLDTIVWSD
jgi:hypothetical protein